MSTLFNPNVIKIYQPVLIQIASKRLLLESPKVQFHTCMHTPAQLRAVRMHCLNHFKDLMLLRVQMY